MPTVNIIDAPRDLYRRTARVVPLATLGFLPVPGQPVTLYDGINDAPGFVYGVDNSTDTATVEPDFQLTMAR